MPNNPKLIIKRIKIPPERIYKNRKIKVSQKKILEGLFLAKIMQVPATSRVHMIVP